MRKKYDFSKSKKNPYDYSHVEDTYNQGAKDYSDYFKVPHEFIEEDRKRFLESLPDQGHILDCGCGPGMDTERFAKAGYTVTAIDLSDRFVEQTRERVPTAQVLKVDMREMPFSDRSFDGIWSSFSLLHVSRNDIPRTLEGFRRTLKPGGSLFVALHRGEQTQWLKTQIAGMNRETFVQEWVQEDLEAELKNAGFKIEYSRPFIRIGGRYPLLSVLARS